MNKVEQTMIDGATYEGSIAHSLLNYALVFFTVLPYLATGSELIRKPVPLWVLLTSVFVQVLLWFSLGATGVSVIWCTMAGFTLMLFLRKTSYVRGKTYLLLAGSLILALSGILYYAFALPPITTIAHGIAVVMGIGLYYLYGRLAHAKK